MNAPFWKGTFAAWVIASVFEMVANGFLLAGEWPKLISQGVLRSTEAQTMALLGHELVLLVAVYLMCEFLEKFKRVNIVKPWKFGFQFGILTGIAAFSTYLFYNIPLVIPVVAIPFHVAGFMAAAWAYHKIDK